MFEWQGEKFEFHEEKVDPIFQQLLDQLQQTMNNVPEIQRKMTEVTGTAWSDDRMIKIVVGPRGQLVDLDIDPRIFRKPDAAAMRSQILATTQKAVREATDKVNELMESQFPPEFEEMRQKYIPERESSVPEFTRTDAEIYAEREDGK
ncbi:YbaB/EbfC family nucleoid-associated protein [Saccharomonospora sp. NPDC006951]